MIREKKLIIVIIALGVLFVGSFTMNIIQLLPTAEQEKETLTIAYGGSVSTIDPADCWDYGSLMAISQVTECLFWYDFRDSNIPLKPLLAESFSWDVANLNLTLYLQRGVYFHDGTVFDANSVKWNVDRWLYLANCTGQLTATDIPSVPSSLYYFPNGTPIIKGAYVIDDYEVKIELNAPFGPFIPFLSYESNGMVSPTAHNQTEFIDYASGDKTIGTGPFVYDSYKANQELRLHQWDRYWRALSYFEVVVVSFMDETATRTQAMFAHDVDIAIGTDPNSFEDFNADSTIELVDAGPSFTYYFWGINNNRYNSTWREAISYAYNYTYMIDEIWLNSVVRGCPAIAEGMPGHNASVQENLPIINITYARELMQSMGFGLGWDTTYQGTSEANWTTAQFATDSLGMPLTLHLWPNSIMNRQMNDLAFVNFQLIGIDTDEEELDYTDFMNYYMNDPDHLHLWIDAFGPDYNDPYSMLIALYDPDSFYNGCQINDTQLMDLLDEALSESDTEKRNDIYKQIQWLVFEVKHNQIPLYSRTLQYVHSSDIEGFPFNPMERFYIWPSYRT